MSIDYENRPMPPSFPHYKAALNYEVSTPLDYWTTGAMLPDVKANGRVRQLETFERFFAGDYGAFLGTLPITINYHRQISTFFSSLLMNHPPEYPDSERLSPRFKQMLNSALRNCIVDIHRFGTGLLFIRQGEDSVEVQALKPIWWFPATDTDSTVITPVGDLFEVRKITQEGLRLEVYERETDIGGRAQFSPFRYPDKLGRLVEVEEWHFEMDWSAIQEHTTGRAGALISIANPPDTGDWGYAKYQDMTDLIFEISRRYSRNSAALDDRDNALLLFEPSDMSAGIPAPHLDEDVLMKWRQQSTYLEQWQKSRTLELPPQYADARYVANPHTLDDHFTQIKEIEKELFKVAGISPVLYGIDESSLPASGTALKIQEDRSAFETRALQTAIMNGLRKAVLTAALLDGASDAELDAMADEVEWQTPFDQRREEQVVTMQDGGEETKDEGEDNMEDVSDEPTD